MLMGTTGPRVVLAQETQPQKGQVECPESPTGIHILRSTWKYGSWKTSQTGLRPENSAIHHMQILYIIKHWLFTFMYPHLVSLILGMGREKISDSFAETPL